jgi:aminoglycoside phosphotransferase (APT) family kinase protein
VTAGWLDDVRAAPPPIALARMAEAIAPGGRVERLKRLGGGLGAAMERFDLALPDGGRRRLVLRRYPRAVIAEDPEVAVRAWRTLGALDRLGVSAPRPVWENLAGEIFGTPAYVMTHLPGHSRLLPRDPDRWLTELARALAGLHRTPLDGADLSFLRGPDETLARRYPHVMREEIRTHPQGTAVQAALARWWPRLRPAAPVLCHNDFWAGNTLWQRGRVTAIVDWDSARIAPAGLDVGYCRMDLAVQRGLEATEVFRRAYEAVVGSAVPQLYFWDLLGAAQALPDIERWLPGFHDLGLTHLTPAVVNERLSAFIDDALDRAARARE